ncbi:hypothetical protein QMZ65_25045 [Pantoea sp. EABMAA-21]|uniref:hypothetical protein n=1 Tax=Pantoea sp. EABMAA-21 TaxID=3043302 RepID=UPI0024B4BB0F|nr:hypothetical protein [Pantoea sp. EABMAA-21]MDI9280481.1 hypothetical protein [Pantoea sp. EABMAA-21]
MKDLKTINVQAAIFTKELISRPDTLYYKLLTELDYILDQQPLINNMPDDVPAEIPRIMSTSTDNKFQFNIAKNRMDFFINFNEEDNDNESNYSLFKSITNTICTNVSAAIGVNRIGIITTTISKSDELKENFMNSYFKKLDKENLTELEYRTNNVKDHKGRLINNIIKISSGEVQVPVIESDCLIIQLDTNNRSLFKNKSEWLDVLDHLFDSSSTAVAAKAVNGE